MAELVCERCPANASEDGALWRGYANSHQKIIQSRGSETRANTRLGSFMGQIKNCFTSLDNLKLPANPIRHRYCHFAGTERREGAPRSDCPPLIGRFRVRIGRTDVTARDACDVKSPGQIPRCFRRPAHRVRLACMLLVKG